MEDNIFGYSKANRPILICPHCGFKHIINFMPFEKKIKAKKVKKLNLGGYYPVIIGASRIADATRVDESFIDDNPVKAGVAWDIAGYKYTEKVSTSSISASIVLNPTGTKLYSVAVGGWVNQYTLSTAWDISTLAYEKQYVCSEVNYGQSVAFNSDGTKMYILDEGNDYVYQYTLTTGWDIGSASYSGKSFNIFSSCDRAYGMCFKPDGYKFYLVSSYYDLIYEFSLGTAWDISTASFENSGAADGDTLGDVKFSADGSIMYLVGGGDIRQYPLSTPWLISSIGSQTKTRDFNPEDTLMDCIHFKEDGTKLYMVGKNNWKARQYELREAWTKTNDFILATRIWGSKGPHVQAFKLRWRKVGGTFADIGATGAINYSADTVLVDDIAILIENRKTLIQSGYTWQNGLENEGNNLLPESGTYSLADEYYTELQWALNCDDAEDEAEYEFELWDTTEGASIGTCLATITMAVASAAKDATGKASITSSVIAVLSRGKIENATGKASITSSIIIKLIRTITRTAKANLISSVIIDLKSGAIKNATGETSITTLLSAILARGKIEDATAKANIATNISIILSRGKVENRAGKAELTSLIQVILSNFIDATGKASINTNMDITLARGKIENATGKASINTSVISILSRGRIEAVTGKSSITSNMESILSRGKIENVGGKASMSSLMVSILSKGKIETTSGKASIGTSVIIVISRGAIKNASGKAEISTNIDSQIIVIKKATAKSSTTSLINVALSRGKIENATGKVNINSSIIIALLRGKIESVTGKANITSVITAVLSRGQIESATGKASINTIFDIIINKGAIENVSGKADIVSNLNVILQKEGATDATGKASITTNIDASLKRIIARAGKASLETSYNAIIGKGKVENVNGKAFIYTSINVNIAAAKRATGKASINSFINIPLKRLINTSGKSVFDTLIEIEITREFAFCQATLGITVNDTTLSVKRTETKLGITEIENNINIER